MINNFKPIDRRTLLRGAGGVAMALPVLEAMSSPHKEVVSTKRMVATGIFFGMMPHLFHPKEVGRDYKTPELLKPLEHLRDEFTIFSGLDHNIGGGHSGTKYFLSGIPVEQSRGYSEGNISVDQKAAEFVGGQTRYPSLALGCHSIQDHQISWTRNSQTLRPIERPSQLFDLLFRNDSPKQRVDRKKAFADRSSILDLVQGQAKSFQHKLSKSDTEKLDQYFTSVRELEVRVERSAQWLDKPKPTTSYQLPKIVDTMVLRDQTAVFYDLMTLALQTDSTRVMTLSFANLGKDNGGLKGVNTGYHTLSHHGKVQAVMEELAIIETFHTSQFARFLDQLKSIQEPDGNTLLDNTMALFGSGMSSANSHSNRDLPILLAGGGFRHGEHKHYARDGRESVQLSNLYLSMLQHLGLPLEKFNKSTGTLTGLEAV